MDSDTINKIIGSVLAAFLLLLLLNFASGKIYGTGEGGHDEAAALAFALEIDESAGAGDEGGEPEAVDYASLIATADPAAGAKAFKKCKACHKLEDGVNAVGPFLWGVVGRDIGSADGFSYSSAIAELEGNWTLQSLGDFLENPKGYAKGTKMTFKGFSDPQVRVNLIVYLNEADGSPEPLE